ncbi:peptide/nickel transport system permease protein [Acetitomaculum ruminis DSM 5522]|uniref:Peptide/nickel transport system permease protein n=1 Tax=Acetitomaculum ruminis DSM 5522 TaxID=1120918 RepID=A0A1I0WNP0_9FIRM|nr:nickel transporter permease [Acetitomaculum ruminis]SFA90007.1 peptide/nickel transport system permease protein [Acetitomaculum ruminis DSM 5522]
MVKKVIDIENVFFYNRKSKVEKLENKVISNFGLKRFLEKTSTKAGFLIIIIFITVALFAPVLAPHDPLLVDVTNKLKNPSLSYPFGTDQLGRCVLSRLIWGARNSLLYSFTVLFATLMIGVPIGLVSGYLGGKVDSVIMRIIDIFMAMPSFIVALAIAGTLGASGKNLVFSMSLVYWAEYARLSRALTMQIKEQSYVMALKAGGCNDFQILFKHVLRNIASSIIALATMEIGSIILSIAGFSFIGLGVQAPTPEWGILLSDSKEYIQTFPSLMIYPGVAIVIVVMAFNLVGGGIQDGLSAKKR